MEKLLTVSIAAYNVEKFIRQTLDSCIVPEIMDVLEVLVIDDGAKDLTAQIAGEYEKRYPGTFKVVNKENGGYGTVVNMGVRLAKGKYFRLLDGDDWFESNGLKQLIEALKTTTADMIFTKMYRVFPDQMLLEKDTWEKYQGRQMPLSDVEQSVFAGMWEITVRTSILQEHWVDLPGKTLYTDHVFLIEPLPYVRDALFLDFPLYCYRLGYDEQSVSLASRKKHIEESVRVSRIVCEYFHNYCANSVNAIYARERARFTFMEAYHALMLKPVSFSTMKEVKCHDLWLKSCDMSIYTEVERWGSKAFKLMRNTNYWGYFLIALKYRLSCALKACKKK